MTTFYLDSTGGSDGNSGLTNFSNAKATLAAALALIAADGDVILVHNAHHEIPGSAISLTLPNFKCSLLCVDKNNSNAKSTGAMIEIGNSNSTFSIINGTGSFESDGVDFSGATNSGSNSDFGIDTSNNGGGQITFRHCKLKLPGTSASAQMALGHVTIGTATRRSRITLDDVEFTLPNRASGIPIQLGHSVIRGRNVRFVYNGATHPPSPFSISAVASAPDVEFSDSDWSNIDGTSYFDIANLVSGEIVLRNIKRHATPTLVSGTWPVGDGMVTAVNTGSGDTIQAFQQITRRGETTLDLSIYADDGAEVFGQHGSLKVVTTSHCTENTPFRLPRILVPHDGTSAITPQFMIAHDSATDMHDRNLHPDWSYVGSTSFPLGSFATGRNASPFLGSPVDWDNNSEAWTGVGGFSSLNRQEIDAGAFTPSEKGVLVADIYCGFAGAKTFYLDPLPRGMGDLGGIVWIGNALLVQPAVVGGGGGGDIGGGSRFNRGLN